MNWFGKARQNAGWLAVDLRQNGIYAAHIKRHATARPLVTLARSYTDGKAISGTIPDKLAKECRTTLFSCTTLLAPSDYQMLSVEAPNVPQDELKSAIRWRLQSLLDFHIDDATIDALDIPPEENAAACNHAMYAIAARSKIVEKRQRLFAEAGIALTAIDIPEMSQRNIASLLEYSGRGIAMLSLDETGGLLTITYGGELYLARRIDATLPQLLNTDPQIKTECLERITLELQRSLDHFDRQYHFITLAKLVLAPLGDEHTGLPEYLAANLYLPTELLNLNDILDLSQTPILLQPAEQQRYFMTLGAALRHEEKVP